MLNGKKKLFRSECGIRLSPYEGNATAGKDVDFDAATFRSDRDVFPWLASVYVAGDDEEVVCSAAFVSRTVLVVSAHCVVDSPQQAITVKLLSSDVARDPDESVLTTENVIIHPDYNASLPSGEHDLAVLKVRVANRDQAVLIRYACLPEVGDDPMGGCQTSTVEKDGGEVVAHSATFAPSISCMENPHLRGYIHSSENIICSYTKCLEEIRGPTFCAVGGRYQLSGMPTALSHWCAIGAETRVARYRDWIADSVEYLEGEPLDREEKVQEQDEGGTEEDEDTPCSKKPCGENAVCWNSGSRFMCTCDDDHPHGNPYYSCHVCLYDQDCRGEGAVCVNRTECMTKERHEIPEEYRKIGGGMYIVSEDELPWPQAQYECLTLHGNLAELATDEQKEAVVRVLRIFNKTGNFWVGASDFEDQGRFTWFHDRTELDLREMEDEPEEGKDQRCIQVSN